MVIATFTVIPIPLFLSTIVPAENNHDLSLMPAAFQMPGSLLVPGTNPSRQYLQILDTALQDMVKESLLQGDPRPQRIIEIHGTPTAGLFATIETDVSPEFAKSVADFNSYLVSSQLVKKIPPADLPPQLPPGVHILPLEMIEETALAAFQGPPPSFATAPPSGANYPNRDTDYPFIVRGTGQVTGQATGMPHLASSPFAHKNGVLFFT